MNKLSRIFPGHKTHSAPKDERDNLTRLLNLGRRRQGRLNRRYSTFVRSMQILLPVLALGLVVIVLAWPKMDEKIVAQSDIMPQKTGQNELVNPRYESADDKGNPYTVTATRALQDMGDSSIVQMEGPVAEMNLAGGDTISGQADQGVYRQQENTLFLQGNVVLKHSNGYTLHTTRLDVAIKTSTALTKDPVTVTGPEAKLNAAGMAADNLAGTIIFTGPARLTLQKSIKGL